MEDEVGERSSFVIGLIENRAKEIGVAAFDLRSASLHLSQYIETSSSYQNTKTLLHFYDPVVIIVPPNKLAPDGMVGVEDLVDKFYSSIRKVIMGRSCFDDTRGAVLVKNFAAKEPSALGLDTYYKQYYLCLAAAAATIKWIEAEKGVMITNHSLLVTESNLGTQTIVKLCRDPRASFFFSFGCEALNNKHICILVYRFTSTQVTFNGSFDHMNIDATSVQNLEIIEPMHSNLWGTSNKKRSIFQMLKTTKTVGGARLLRANLLQPLKDIETIEARLNCLDELMSNEELFFGLSQALRKFPKETDRVLCHFCFKQKKVTNDVLGPDNARKSQVLISSIILLKTALDALPLLSRVLKDAKSLLLSNVYKSTCQNEKYGFIRKRIGEVIDEDVLHARVPFVARTQQCFAVKAGIDGLLDVARRSFCDTSEAIHNLANKYREEFKLPNLKIPFNNRQGFYFSIPQKDLQGKLPSKFIQVMKHGNNIHCSTLELASLNVRNKSASEECYMRTELCLEALMDAIREDVSVLTLLAEVLCLLDMIVNSFAHLISTKPVDQYSRPQFTESGPFAIDAGRHPILESIHTDFISNNLFLSEASNMIIVTGPNMKSGVQMANCYLDTYAEIVSMAAKEICKLGEMHFVFQVGTVDLCFNIVPLYPSNFSTRLYARAFRSGKSTYLQQVCLIVILAQIGCYVPARFATIRVVDRIFTRMGTMDSLESNSSTFMTEMKETAFIMQNVSQRARSLIVMDELGRATSSSDGFSIAWSCCEHLLALKTYTIFSTHMENLSELATIYPNVKIVHFLVEIKSNRLDFKFQLKDGPRHIPHYGLLLAGVAGLPRSVIESAGNITAKITAKEVKRMEVNCQQYNAVQMAYHVAQRLICLKYSDQDENSIRHALQNLKDSFVEGRLLEPCNK